MPNGHHCPNMGGGSAGSTGSTGSSGSSGSFAPPTPSA
jgi:hypothetical protein